MPAGPLRLPRREGGCGNVGAALVSAPVGDKDVCPPVTRACSPPVSLSTFVEHLLHVGSGLEGQARTQSSWNLESS